CTGVAAYSATTIYNPGDKAVYKSQLWHALITIWNTPPDHCPACQYWANDGACGSTTNQPPTVALTAPPNGASVAAGTAITVPATASDLDGSVTQAQFRDGTSVIGTDTTSPYSISWTGAAAGSHTLTAVATDNAGASTTSTSVTITVTGGGTNRP